jgi:glycosyltransferase involved in cell wall biosynthesis
MKQLFLGKVLEGAKDYDIIHFQTEPVYLGMPFVNLVETPIIFTPHHPFYESDRAIYNFYDGKIKMSAISKYQASKYPMKQNLPVVYNGINIEEFDFSPMSEEYYLYLGRFTKDKGIEDFIELAKSNPGKKFVVAGAGALEEAVIVASGNLKNLESKGYLSRGEAEWKRILANAKALIMPTVGEESFGMVMIEAMAFGTPVIAYNKCAAPEIVDDNENGFIVPELRISGLIKAIKKINSLDETSYLGMRKKARIKVEQNFTSKVMAENYEKLYQNIVSKN